MSRILSRPMFRKGGSTNKGIMDGLVDRKGYKQGTTWDEVVTEYPHAKEAYDLMSTIDKPKDTSFYEMLIGGGLETVSGKHAGEGLLANLAGSYKGPSEKFFEQKRATGDYDRKLKQTAAQAGLEQKWELERIKEKDDPQRALKNVYLQQAIENGYDAPEAQRIADYQVTTKTQLQNKVGRESVGGVLEFDVNDQDQAKKNKKRLKKQAGKYFYDPYDGTIKLVVIVDGQVQFQVFNSVADITFGDLTAGASTETSTPYADALEAREQEKSEGILTDEDILAQRFP